MPTRKRVTAGRFTVQGQHRVSVIADNGGIPPTGILQLVIIASGGIFAYAAVELVGNSGGRDREPGEGDAEGHQLGGPADRGVLRRPPAASCARCR
ncbi:hypothetical protein [Mycolicibacterium sp. P9-64]|uniref:hypothetical protein n=1 Tax=Mycolicibacterium sp. P9-64 TaxID=2024612 RepID=UPI001F5B95D7|nr:hypothetical protein [Mycolicibacterium sp. P9-64]